MYATVEFYSCTVPMQPWNVIMECMFTPCTISAPQKGCQAISAALRPALARAPGALENGGEAFGHGPERRDRQTRPKKIRGPDSTGKGSMCVISPPAVGSGACVLAAKVALG